MLNFTNASAGEVPDTTSLTPAVQKLSRAVTFETVSTVNKDDFRYEEFLKLHDYLEQAFPLLHDRLQKTVINEYSLLFTWQGNNPDLKPILLSAHLDVVPVEKASEDDWKEHPYKGIIKEGYVWGRGTMDDKYRVIAMMEAVEQQLEQGYAPDRTIYLAFGHDEEVGGYAGAGKINEYLEEQGVQLEAIFDEGLAVAEDVVPGLKDPVALIGTAAKGNINLKLTVQGVGGHSSAPPKETPIYVLSRALTRLHNKPFKPRMIPTTKETLNTLAGELGGKYKFAMRHYGLFKGKVLKMLAKDQATNALIRTIMSPTVMEAGEKYNVLPREASAIVNIRILNGEDRESVIAHVRKVVRDERVNVEVHGVYTPPSQITETNTAVYKALKASIHETYPGVMVVPALFPGSSDAKHYTNLTDNIFRFAPQVVNRENAKLVHNANERMSVEGFHQAITFYDSLIRNTCGLVETDALVQQEEEEGGLGVTGE
ncbi:M20/M25/M40 family metallo-hydrolase [Pontibacter ummariensis]|nr:M20/M25/M40 family metallo-hydrolase [Pontibacter ummariensis]